MDRQVEAEAIRRVPDAIRGEHAELEEIERLLGSPLAGDGPMTFRAAREADEREEFPAEALSAIHALGLFDELVPKEWGGRFVGPSRLLQICRLFSRRDLTVAVAIGQSFLGATPVWLGGTAAQRERVATLLRRGLLGAIALTEEAHGSDLLANDFSALRVAGSAGRVVNGRKWAINNGTRGSFYCAFARTDVRGGPPGFTLVFLDREAMPPGSLESLPKLRTHGIRGADISGFVVREARCDDSCLVGAEGSGFELAMKTLQITRTLCAGFSLGSADTALRTTLGFALDRTLFGRPVAAMEHVRSSFAEAYATVLAAEAVARRACDTLERLPHEGPIASAVAKVVVPILVEDVVAQMARIIGARGYLRDVLDSGAFEKLRRDAAVVSLFDGSVPVNLATLAAQLALVVPQRQGDMPKAEVPQAPPRALTAERMRVVSKTDHVVSAALAGVCVSPSLAPLQERVVGCLRAIDDLVLRAIAEQRELFRVRAGAAQLPMSTRGQQIAWRYALAHAASCVLTAPADDPLVRMGDPRLASAVARVLLGRLEGRSLSLPPDEIEAAWDRLVAQHRSPELFSADRVRIQHG